MSHRTQWQCRFVQSLGSCPQVQQGVTRTVGNDSVAELWAQGGGQGAAAAHRSRLGSGLRQSSPSRRQAQRRPWRAALAEPFSTTRHARPPPCPQAYGGRTIARHDAGTGETAQGARWASRPTCCCCGAFERLDKLSTLPQTRPPTPACRPDGSRERLPRHHALTARRSARPGDDCTAGGGACWASEPQSGMPLLLRASPPGQTPGSSYERVLKAGSLSWGLGHGSGSAPVAAPRLATVARHTG